MDKRDGELGTRLREARQARGLSQEQVAEIIGVGRSTISQIENGKRVLTARDLSKITGALGISAEEFLDSEKEIHVVLEGAGYVHEEQQMRINVPQKNVRKFKEVLLYILERVGSLPNVGETVIYKLLYFIDFDFYEKYEEQLVGATYIKNRYGPTPVEFKEVIAQMLRDGELTKVKDSYFNYPQTKYLPRREPRLEILKASELKTIDDVLCRLAHMDASMISDYSHRDVPWLSAANGGIIEYESVFYRNAPYSQRSYEESVRPYRED